MDITVLASGGAVAFFDLSLGRLLVPTVGRPKRQQPRLPTTLPGVLSSSVLTGDTVVPIVALHVQRARLLGSSLAGTNMELHAKYGDPGASVQASTSAAQVTLDRPAGACFTGRGFREKGQQVSPLESVAEFNSTVLFLGDHDREPVLRLRLRTAGRCGSVLAKACLPLPCTHMGLLECAQDHDLPLWRAGCLMPDLVGHLQVVVRTQAVMLRDLRRLLPQLGCRTQRDAVVRDTVPVTLGEIVPLTAWQHAGNLDDEEVPMEGLPVTEPDREPWGLWARLSGALGRRSKSCRRPMPVN